jgi:SH3-like domain-containing protein
LEDELDHLSRAPGRSRRGLWLPLLAAFFLTLSTVGGAAQPSRSGLPLPRFASLDAERINARTGPGKQYPIRWVYARKTMPVKIVDEFDTWRRIEDPDGDRSWVHVSLLSGRRTAMVVGETRSLRRMPDAESRALARMEPGVIGRLLGCSGAWCELEVGSSQGWVERTAIWGVLETEWPAPAS